MNYLEYLKNHDNFDKYLLFLDALGFSGDEIATMTGVTRQTVHNAKSRQENLLEALKLIHSEPKEHGNPDVNAIIGAFTESFGTTKSTKYDRWAAHRLAMKHGASVIVNIIKALAASRGDKYCPSVNSVKQIEEKWVNIANYIGRQQANNQVVEL